MSTPTSTPTTPPAPASATADEAYAARLWRRHLLGHVFGWVCAMVTWFAVAFLILILGALVYQAWGWLTPGFLARHNHYIPEKAGILSGLWGSFWVIMITALFSVPMGVGAAVYLEEYAKPNWVTRQIQLNIANLAGVPSVVYGILGFSVFVRMFGLVEFPQKYALSLGFAKIQFTIPLGPVVLSAALTLMILSLPVVIIAAQEALRSVPASLRHASYALGATKWQTIRFQVLPAALPGILTGVILAMSRALGETAPLVVLGAASQINYSPGKIDTVGELLTHPSQIMQAPFDRFTAMPLQVFSWVNEISSKFQNVAAAGIVVLLVSLLLLNGSAILIRQYFQQKIRW